MAKVSEHHSCDHHTACISKADAGPGQPLAGQRDPNCTQQDSHDHDKGTGTEPNRIQLQFPIFCHPHIIVAVNIGQFFLSSAISGLDDARQKLNSASILEKEPLGNPYDTIPFRKKKSLQTAIL